MFFVWPLLRKNIGNSILLFNFVIQFSLWPLLLLYFPTINLLAIPANIVISPLVELLSILLYVFLLLHNLPWPFLTTLMRYLISIVMNIFFKILEILEHLPGKSIAVDQNKSLIIALFLLIDLLVVLWLICQKSLLSKKNKYKILAKWANAGVLLKKHV